MDTASRTHKDAPAEQGGNSIGASGPETLTHDEVSEIMFRAHTLEEIAVAWQVRSVYLQANPNDEGILEEGESLWMLEQALKYPDAPTAPPQAERAA